MKQSFNALLITGIVLAGAGSAAGAANQKILEDYAVVPMPQGVQILYTELDGPVFADEHGKTMYVWPQKAMRVGFAGDPKNKSVCGDEITTKTAGMMSPWPPGMDLPELDKRLSCAETWPPVLAPEGAEEMGRWTVIKRASGKQQWAYDKLPVYTSILDRGPGETNGGSATFADRGSGTQPARLPVGPPPNVPPGFNVITRKLGRMVVNETGYSVYISDHDTPNLSNCIGDCARTWIPVNAPSTARPQGEWTIIDRAAGVRQWAFREKPVYTFLEDTNRASFSGGDVPGWNNVFTQMGPKHPEDFSVEISLAGDVLADADGNTIYYYTCGDDSFDQLACDTMDSPQVYRIAIAGGGDWHRALKMWPYVQASANAKSSSLLWSVVYVDPQTGRRADTKKDGAMRVWAYMDRPIYTYAGDKQPGDIEGNGIGEWQGKRNGYRAFYIREEFARRG
jgi:predicted lipoprotein with Yx(FWY)xxD motif